MNPRLSALIEIALPPTIGIVESASALILLNR